jgi:lipopolysaccharide biosynthesis glycosyltransferase
MDVVCAVEGDYAPHTGAMLHSLLERNAGAGVRVYCLHGAELNAADRQRLAQVVDEIEFVPVDDEPLAGLPTEGYLGSATWYRLLVARVLDRLDRVLYLDSDLIVTGDLSALWSTQLGDALVAAVTNVFAPWDAGRPGDRGFAPNEYFNAGVLLMDLARMRAERTDESLLAFARAHADRMEWRDQDALNHVLKHRRLALHPRWNCTNALVRFRTESDAAFGAEAAAEARGAPAVRHFEGPGANKPWHYLADRDARELYERHRRATPWPDVHLEGRSPGNVVRRALQTAAGAVRGSRDDVSP